MKLRLVVGLWVGVLGACGGGGPIGARVTPTPSAHAAAVDGMKAAGWLESVDLERGQATVAPKAWDAMEATQRAEALAEISAYLVEQRGGSPRVLVRDGANGRILGVWEPGEGYAPVPP